MDEDQEERLRFLEADYAEREDAARRAREGRIAQLAVTLALLAAVVFFKHC